MKKYLLAITLLSDLCTSNGGIYNDSVDTEASYDSYGLPYIPAKRIKGSLRECAQELNDWGDNIDINRLFGMPGNQRGCLSVRNAHIKDHDQYIRDLNSFSRHHGDKALTHPQNVLRCFTYLRNQTSIDSASGVADDTSLRTMRVVSKGNVFYADIELPEEDEIIADLKKCCAVYRHMGVARTRGFGEIKAELLPAERNEGHTGKEYEGFGNYSGSNVSEKDREFSESLDEKETRYKLTYQLDLLEPVICKSVNGQEEKSLDYIDGGKILGCVAGLMKQKGKSDEDFIKLMKEDEGIIFSNAYISDHGQRLEEVPAYFYTIKNNGKDIRCKAYQKKNSENNEDAGLQLNAMKHCYVAYTGKNELTRYTVDMEEHYHHRRPLDKSIGHVRESFSNDNEMGKFYQISAICPGQSYEGFIEGSARQINEIRSVFTGTEYVYLGYGSSSEYGKSRLVIKEDCSAINPDHKPAETTKGFAVVLNSPTVIYNEKATYSTDKKDLINEINAALNIQNVPSDAETFINLTSVGGFNVTWEHRKPTLMAFDKGSAIIYKDIPVPKTDEGTIFLGERNSEGYGEAIIKPIEEDGCYQWILKKPESKVDGFENTKKSESAWENESNIIHDIAGNIFKDYLEKQAIDAADSNYKANELSGLKPTISNMLLMCKNDNSLDAIKKDCDKRFKVVDESKKEKGCTAEKIMKKTEALYETSVNAFKKYYGLKDFEADEGEKVFLLHCYLVYLKYKARQEKDGDES